MTPQKNIVARPATLADAKAINLRQEDLAELALLYATIDPEDVSGPLLEDLAKAALRCTPTDPVTVIEASISNAMQALTFEDQQGHIVAIAGFSVRGSDALPWMFTSELFEQHTDETLRIGMEACAACRSANLLASGHISNASSTKRGFIERLGFITLRAPGSFQYFYLPTNV